MDIEEIESILCCPICIEVLDGPRILPCQHSFCEECLSSYIKDRTKNIRAGVKSFPCPVCRHETKLKKTCDDATAFPKDLTKIFLLESKDTLLEPDDINLVESNTCETQTMTVNTEASDDNVNGKIFMHWNALFLSSSQQSHYCMRMNKFSRCNNSLRMKGFLDYFTFVLFQAYYSFPRGIGRFQTIKQLHRLITFPLIRY